jgi:tetratricopeptide (TPR) repeat protein
MRLVFIALILSIVSLRAADVASTFDTANRLYEQRKFQEAAQNYEKLLQAGAASPIIYFNLGNAWYKAGQLGRAIAAYREAQRLAPRDPNVRFNLQFVRKQVTGSEQQPGAVWQQWLGNLTVNEWTITVMVAYWVFFILLMLGEIRASLRAALRLWTSAAAVVCLALGFLFAAAIQYEQKENAAVVVVPNTVVRYGPLDESDVYYQLRDGSELQVLDQKTAANQSWLMVQDAARRTGWLKRQEVVVLNGKESSS